MPITCCHVYYYWSDGSFVQFVVQPNREFFYTFLHEFHADIIMLSTSTSHPPVLLFLVFANFKIMSLPSIDLSLPVATDVLDSLIQYINLFLSTKFPLHKMCS